MEISQAKTMLCKNAAFLGASGVVDTFSASLSMRFEESSFIINKQDMLFAVPNSDDFMLLQGKKDYRWKEASEHALIHQNIFKSVVWAKFACVCMPPFITAYGLEHASFEPKDIMGASFGNIFIYDTKQSDDWLERAPSEIIRHFSATNSNTMLLKGAGVCIYERSFTQLARKLITLENSAKFLAISKRF